MVKIDSKCICQNEVFEQLNSLEASCDDNCQGLISEKIELVSTIYECEKTLDNYIPVIKLNK